VGYASNKIDKVWQQISRKGLVRTGRNFVGSYRGVGVPHHPDRCHLALGVLLRSQNIEGCKKVFVMFFSPRWFYRSE